MVHAWSAWRCRTEVQGFDDSQGRILPACSASTLQKSFKNIRKKVVSLELHSAVSDVNQDTQTKSM